jgi:anthranilate/para-aminobenzoate synthase component I
VTEWLEAHEGFLRKTKHELQEVALPEFAQSEVAPAVVWRRSDDRYRADVEACRSAIRKGEAYVLCLTDTAEARGSFEPLELYRRLRRSGAASRGGVIVTTGRALVSGSPERFLSIRGNRVATHPIKGTRPRGNTPAHDRALALELAEDPKEQAENLMIVDLMRNDLSRVCDAGTVSVDRFLEVETHPHVHQLVSSVSGRIAAGAGLEQVLEACFPGGSMTGAPKRRAVELLAELEGRPRGLYSGCFGWIDASGDAELAMTIRGIELRGDGRTNYDRALIGAGGGITVDSNADREVAEKHLKADSLIAALYP